MHAGSDKHVVQQSDGWAVEVADMEEVLALWVEVGVRLSVGKGRAIGGCRQRHRWRR